MPTPHQKVWTWPRDVQVGMATPLRRRRDGLLPEVIVTSLLPLLLHSS